MLNQHDGDSTQKPTDDCDPLMYVVERTKDWQCVARIRSGSASSIDLFSLRLLVMTHGLSSYEDARDFNGQPYGTYRKMANSSRLLTDGPEFDISFQEAAEINSTSAQLRRLVVTLYQEGADPEKIAMEEWEVLCSDMCKGDEQQLKQEMYRSVAEISDRHGRRLLQDHIFFAHYIQQDCTALTETIHSTTTRDACVSQNTSKLHSRYVNLKSGQRKVIETDIDALRQRKELQQRPSTPGKGFCL